MSSAFHHRTAFAPWINDMRNVGMPGEKWPHAGFDDATVGGLQTCLDLMARSGFNEFDVFGLFTSYAWPLDIRSAVDQERGLRVRSILDYAHDKGIRVVCGLGVYSWGFDEIIARDPGVKGTNPRAMCASRDASWDWMTKVIDFVLHEFEVDGFHLESADQGRCECSDCQGWSNAEYHCRINTLTAQYVRTLRGDALLSANLVGLVPWGSTLDREDRGHFVELSRHLDAIVDPGHVGTGFIADDDIEEFIQSLHCDFGTSGGAWVYPPQRWDRLRWFLPYTKRTGAHLRRLYAVGGRAVDYYMGPTINPGVEMSIAYGGRLLSNVERSDVEILSELVDELYRPRDASATAELVSIFRRAEAAYYDNFDPHAPRTADVPGELHLEPLFGSQAGPAIYLAGTRPDDQPFSGGGLAAYRAALVELSDDVARLEGRVGDSSRLGRIATCLRGVIADIDGF
jgi:hypothetical protein